MWLILPYFVFMIAFNLNASITSLKRVQVVIKCNASSSTSGEHSSAEACMLGIGQVCAGTSKDKHRAAVTCSTGESWTPMISELEKCGGKSSP